MGQLIDEDQEHLRLLKLGFYILAGMSAALSMFILFYVGLAGFIVSAVATEGASRGGVKLPLWIVPVIGGVLLLFGAATTFLTWFTGHSLGERRHRTFCMIVSGLCCFQVPFGSAIGVSALIVLSRPSVKDLFEGRALPPAIPPALPLR